MSPQQEGRIILFLISAFAYYFALVLFYGVCVEAILDRIKKTRPLIGFVELSFVFMCILGVVVLSILIFKVFNL